MITPVTRFILRSILRQTLIPPYRARKLCSVTKIWDTPLVPRTLAYRTKGIKGTRCPSEYNKTSYRYLNMKYFTLLVSLSLASVSIAAAVPGYVNEGLLKRQETPVPIDFSNCQRYCGTRPVVNCVRRGNGIGYACG
ncbi:hypothetical protein HYFRA_00005843 [Hymenoscyphus fraxineus]|uniref:Uncharacterized protein n=1 Tax=Hymenoscyphus fraxineus TaxID=746836 RepID=A0A9N9KX56_9HELO|nr:hypothetical protein HYFRA_00005843 [Hymenoscyphus fraxineus]